MLTGWADHCSSDEEDILEDEREARVEEKQETVSHDETKSNKRYEYPSKPPYTAYIGNVAHDIDTPERLAGEISGLARQFLDLELNVVDSRIAFDRHGDKPRHRGFGYVQLATVEQLQQLMQLNEKDGVMVAGKRITVDTADNKNSGGGSGRTSRSGGGGRSGAYSRGSSSSNNKDANHSNNDNNTTSGGDFDGTKFRGGRYASSDRRRRDGNNSGNANIGGGDRNSGGDQKAPTAGRPSLQLQPRTKPREAGAPSTSPTVFGGGRARDEESWSSVRNKTTTTTTGDAKDGQRGGNRRASGRGGKEGARTAGKLEDNKKNDRKSASLAAKAPPPAPKVVPPKPAEPNQKITNRFAALDFGSDSE
jgi:hypothetical protein